MYTYSPPFRVGLLEFKWHPLPPPSPSPPQSPIYPTDSAPDSRVSLQSSPLYTRQIRPQNPECPSGRPPCRPDRFSPRIRTMSCFWIRAMSCFWIRTMPCFWIRTMSICVLKNNVFCVFMSVCVCALFRCFCLCSHPALSLRALPCAFSRPPTSCL